MYLPGKLHAAAPVRPTVTSYVEQVERHFEELEIFRQRVNAFPKQFEMYIDFKSISAAWEWLGLES